MPHGALGGRSLSIPVLPRPPEVVDPLGSATSSKPLAGASLIGFLNNFTFFGVLEPSKVAHERDLLKPRAVQDLIEECPAIVLAPLERDEIQCKASKVRERAREFTNSGK